MNTLKILAYNFDRLYFLYGTIKYCTFKQNLERLLLGCKLIDYYGEYQSFLDEKVVFWRNSRERERYMMPFVGLYHHINTFDSRTKVEEILSSNESQEILNMAWIVEYFIFNGYNMRTVPINDIYQLWKDNLPKLFGDIDEETLTDVMNMDVVTK